MAVNYAIWTHATSLLLLLLLHMAVQQEQGIAIPVIQRHPYFYSPSTTATDDTLQQQQQAAICPQGVACSTGLQCAGDGSTLAFEGSALCCPATITCPNGYAVDNNLCACVPLGCPMPPSGAMMMDLNNNINNKNVLVYERGGGGMACTEATAQHEKCPLSLALCISRGMVLLEDCTCVRTLPCLVKKQPFLIGQQQQQQESFSSATSSTSSSLSNTKKGTWWRSGRLKFTCVFF